MKPRKIEIVNADTNNLFKVVQKVPTPDGKGIMHKLLSDGHPSYVAAHKWLAGFKREWDAINGPRKGERIFRVLPYDPTKPTTTTPTVDPLAEIAANLAEYGAEWQDAEGPIGPPIKLAAHRQCAPSLGRMPTLRLRHRSSVRMSASMFARFMGCSRDPDNELTQEMGTCRTSRRGGSVVAAVELAQSCSTS